MFTPTDIYAPDKSLKIKTWNFQADLNKFFPDAEYGNNTIGDTLVKRRVLKKSEVDTESDCLYAEFKTKKAALAFIARLNKQPEIANYVEPEPIPEEMLAFGVEDWRKIRSYLKELLTPEQWTKLQSGPMSEIGMYEILCVKDGLGHPSLVFKAEMEAMVKRSKKR